MQRKASDAEVDQLLNSFHAALNNYETALKRGHVNGEVVDYNSAKSRLVTALVELRGNSDSINLEPGQKPQVAGALMGYVLQCDNRLAALVKAYK